MITVVDYGMGNLRSVSKALESLGGNVKVSACGEDIQKADKLVLPGVGSYGDAVRELHQRNLFEPILDYLKSHRPFLGICLGLQLLFTSSEESPEVSGFGIFPGKVRSFVSSQVKIPHMGWNQIRKRQEHPLLRTIPNGTYFYFVHSFFATPESPQLTLASCTYGDEEFTAILGNERIFATQFHPEKSQQAGLEILKNFLQW